MVGWGVSSSVRSTVSVYYFNTVRRAVYYVLYVLIFIIYNTVFLLSIPVCTSVYQGRRPHVYLMFTSRLPYVYLMFTSVYLCLPLTLP